MSYSAIPFAVRLLGFPAQEEEALEAVFKTGKGFGWNGAACGYARLAEHNLQDPDLYVANASHLRTLATLTDLRPSDVRPALLVGRPVIDLPYARIERPVRPAALFKALDALIEKRADALSRLEASDIISVPERRRGDRVDLDLTDPTDYARMRLAVPDKGGVLVVDKNPAFRDYLAKVLAGRRTEVAWFRDETQAIEACRQQAVSLVLINTSTPGIDPYRLSWAIREREGLGKTVVIFLVGKPFLYDPGQAQRAGVEGFLNKPVASHHLKSVLKKFLSPAP